MKVVITSGHPDSGYRLVHKALETAGIESARESRREEWTPSALCEAILRAHDADPNASGALIQLSPGKVWQDLAIDLFLGNLSSENWGWADASATWLLDFWLRFDGQTRFVLAYSCPVHTITNMMLQAKTTIDSLPIAVKSWIHWNGELLQFSARHPDRCLLVNTVAALERPGEFILSANDIFNLDLAEPPAGNLNNERPTPALASFLTNALVDEFHEALALYDELESAAHVQVGATGVRAVPVRHAWEEYLASLSLLERLQLELAQKHEQCRLADFQIQSADNVVRESTKQLEEVRARLENAQQAGAAVDEQEAELLLRNTALMKENELLFLQLKQLQDALDETALAHRESERQRIELASRPAKVAAHPVSVSTKSHLSEVVLDMRQEIDGKNWYWAEHDGRWAGPDTQGTLRLPAMGAGAYEVNLDVVDAMDPEILAGMQVMICGIPLSLTREGKSYPANLKGVVTVQDAVTDGDWDVSFRFPSLSSPAQHGSSDSRQLAIRLRSIRLRALQNYPEIPNLTN